MFVKVYKNPLIYILMLYVFFEYLAQETLLPTQLHSLVMYIMVFFVMLFTLMNRVINFSVYTKWYFGLMCLSFCSFIYSDHFTTGAAYTMFVILIITYCFSYIIDDYSKYNLIVKTFVIAADLMGLMIFATGQAFDVSNRLGTSISGNANVFSALLMVAAIFSGWLLITNKTTKGRFFYSVSLLFQLALMGLSGGRKTIIAVVVCFIWFILSKEKNFNFKLLRNITLVILAIIGLFFSMINIPIFYNTIGERFLELFSLVRGGTSAISSDSIRKKMIQIAINAWRKSPIVGYGLDNFRFYNVTITGRFYYAHNNYAELLYDLGVIGFVLYYSFLIVLIRKVRKVSYILQEYKSLIIGLIIELLLFDIGGVSYYQILPQIVLCMAFIAYNISNKIKPTSVNDIC